jgi:hypothetical protein
MPDQTLRSVIQMKLAMGLLPRARPRQVWAGNGAGEPCDACDATIKPGAVMYEWDDTARAQKFRLHRWCYDLWLDEIERPG